MTRKRGATRRKRLFTIWDFRFLKPAPPYSKSQKAGETGPRMVVVLNAALQKRADVARLDQLDDELRLRLAAQAAAAVAFDWDVAAGTIRWDGATEILPDRKSVV